jgi:hypothetical protein
VISHRDFAPFNVLVGPGPGDLGVIDWEHAEVEGLPGLDLLYMLSYLTFHVEDAWHTERIPEVFSLPLDPTTKSGAVRAECVSRYWRALRLDPAALEPLMLLVWLLRSRREYQLLLDQSSGRPEPAALRRSMCHTLWAQTAKWIDR